MIAVCDYECVVKIHQEVDLDEFKQEPIQDIEKIKNNVTSFIKDKLENSLVTDYGDTYVEVTPIRVATTSKEKLSS